MQVDDCRELIAELEDRRDMLGMAMSKCAEQIARLRQEAGKTVLNERYCLQPGHTVWVAQNGQRFTMRISHAVMWNGTDSIAVYGADPDGAQREVTVDRDGIIGRL